MTDLNQDYNLNSLCILMIIFLYNVYQSNYYYFHLILNKILLLNYTSLFIIINIIGIYILLKNLTIEINIKCSMKYK